MYPILLLMQPICAELFKNKAFRDTQLASPDQKGIAFNAGISPLQDRAHSEDTLVKLSQQEAEFRLFITRKESRIRQETSRRRLPDTERHMGAWPAGFYSRPWKFTHRSKTSR